MMILNEVAALTDEIQQDTGLDTDAAAALAWSMISDLLDGVDENTRYVPCRVVMFEAFSVEEMNMEHEAANANAALVVAAPDLLAACQEAYEQMHGLIRRLSDAGLYGLPEDLHGGKNPKTLMLLREVIGLATG